MTHSTIALADDGMSIEFDGDDDCPELTSEEAEEVTRRIRQWVNDFPVEDVVTAFRGRIWIALAYASWGEWCECELGGLKLPAPKRRQVVAELAGEGMSNRAIADAIGSSEPTVRRDLSAGASNDAPVDRTVTGQDGKTYTPQPKADVPQPETVDAEIVCRDCDGYGCKTCFPNAFDDSCPITGLDELSFHRSKPKRDPKPDTFIPPSPVVPDGKFATFVADPPWQYGNTSTRGAAEDHYPTMSIEELRSLDVVPSRAHTEAHLYLWTTAGHLPEAFSVMEAWGFEYKTYLVWVKPQMGMGNYFRVSTELVLFGVRGGMRTRARNIKNYFEASRAKHSAKPVAFHDIVQTASPGPYLELFSRCYADDVMHGCTCSKCRLGWTVWGNQS